LKRTLEKSQTNATNVIFASTRAEFLRQHLKTHSEKNQTNGTNVIMPLFIEAI
jgi:hypothetical protein